MGEDDRNPFKGKNVVAAMLGHDPVPKPKPGLPTGVDVLRKEEAEKERQAKLRKMKPWQRKKYERDRQRKRWSVYIPKGLSDLVDEISNGEAVSPSSAASWLIVTGYELWKSGKIPPPTVVRARSIRMERSLEMLPGWEDRRVQRTFDSDDFEEIVAELTHRYKCGRSDAVAWLMSGGATAYRNGVTPKREPSDSIRYPFRLKLSNALKRSANDEKQSVDVSPERVLKTFFSGE